MTFPASQQVTWQSTQIVSVVSIVYADSSAQAVHRALQALHAELTFLGTPFEIVVVINSGAAELLETLHTLAAQLSDLQFYALQYPVDTTTASLAGLEHAVGDWVATFDLETDHPSEVIALYRAVSRDRTEVGLPRPRRRGQLRRWHLDLVSMLFHRLFRSIHGFSLEESTPTLRWLSRRVVNAILQHDNPLVAFDTLSATSGYRKTILLTEPHPRPRHGFRDLVRARWRVLIGLNALPLRLANALCGVGACTAILYSFYTVVVYLLKPDVMPGWTTVSLMLSCSFFLTSLVLGLLSEYMIMIMDASARRPRYHTADEFASLQQSRQQCLNVESEGKRQGPA